jgi:hypothetical protein
MYLVSLSTNWGTLVIDLSKDESGSSTLDLGRLDPLHSPDSFDMVCWSDRIIPNKQTRCNNSCYINNQFLFRYTLKNEATELKVEELISLSILQALEEHNMQLIRVAKPTW